MTVLRQRMLEDMQVRNLSPDTQRAYLETVARFARHFGRSPAVLGPEEIRAYQVYLTRERHLPSSLVIAACALRFVYKVTLKRPWSFDAVIPAPKKPLILPVVLSPDEVVHFLTCVRDPAHRAILTTCYAAGVRISEAVHLRPTDIDSRRMVIRIDQGKGQLDRYVMLSPKLLALLPTELRSMSVMVAGHALADREGGLRAADGSAVGDEVGESAVPAKDAGVGRAALGEQKAPPRGGAFFVLPEGPDVLGSLRSLSDG